MISDVGLMGLIIQQIAVGPIIGWVAALLEGYLLQQIYNDALAEITITLCFTYLTFYVGEAVRFTSDNHFWQVLLGCSKEQT